MTNTCDGYKDNKKMKQGKIQFYGFELFVVVDNGAIVSLSLGRKEGFEELSSEEVREIERSIIRGDYVLSPRGSSFELAVWDALVKIPYGETSTYKRIAESIGRPTACRAVANAIGRNPIAILIPCHRVLRTDGSLGGFFWGTEVKRRLLDFEATNKTRD